jgi:hypothetical protein
LDEDNLLYKAEEIYRKVSAYLQMGVNAFDAVSSLFGAKRSKSV